MILGAIMVPHPPIIVSEIGQGREKEVQETIDSYHKAAKTLASWKPETIIILSPHAEMYKDYFQISSGAHASGSFAAFGARDVRFEVDYDQELVEKICQLSKENQIPAGCEYPLYPQLDHGVMVPLYFLNQYIQDVPIVRIGLSGCSLQVHQEFGKIIEQACQSLNHKVAVIASGDLSHYCQEDGPYGFREQAPMYEKEIMEAMGSGDLDQLLDFDEEFLHQAGECGHRSFTILSGILSESIYETQCLSHQDILGVGYGVCIYTCKDPYVCLARQTIESFTRTGQLPIFKTVPSFMENKQAGVFVSIHKHNQLRGCIGTFLPTQENVAQEVIRNAVSASTQDPRFYPIEAKELKDLEISVDVLSQPEHVEDISELDVKKYGVIVFDSYGRRGLLLPNLEGVDTVNQQIEIAASKAGILDIEDIQIEKFTVERHGEEL